MRKLILTAYRMENSSPQFFTIPKVILNIGLLNIAFRSHMSSRSYSAFVDTNLRKWRHLVRPTHSFMKLSLSLFFKSKARLWMKLRVTTIKVNNNSIKCMNKHPLLETTSEIHSLKQKTHPFAASALSVFGLNERIPLERFYSGLCYLNISVQGIFWVITSFIAIRRYRKTFFRNKTAGKK